MKNVGHVGGCRLWTHSHFTSPLEVAFGGEKVLLLDIASAIDSHSLAMIYQEHLIIINFKYYFMLMDAVFCLMARSILWLYFGAFMKSCAPHFVLLSCFSDLLISLIFHIINTIPNLNPSSMFKFIVNTSIKCWWMKC